MSNKGFTLLEVLVAGFILFLAISTATAVYSSSIKSKISATSSIKISAFAPLIRDDIKTRLLSAEGDAGNGKGHFMGVDFEWKARVSDKRNALSTFSPDSAAGQSTTNKAVKLWSVELTLAEKKHSEYFQFSVVGWES